jgi:hypothetical protein
MNDSERSIEYKDQLIEDLRKVLKQRGRVPHMEIWCDNIRTRCLKVLEQVSTREELKEITSGRRKLKNVGRKTIRILKLYAKELEKCSKKSTPNNLSLS